MDRDEKLDKLCSHYEIDLNGNRSRVYDLVPQVLDLCKDVDHDGRIDFDDMIWLPVVRNLPVFRYDLLLVDECQDLNRLAAPSPTNTPQCSFHARHQFARAEGFGDVVISSHRQPHDFVSLF